VARDALRDAAARVDGVRGDTKKLIREVLPEVETRDTDFVFLSFVLEHIPIGLVGLLIAVILCAAMSSVASELIALGATSTVDFYLRIRQALGYEVGTSTRDLRISQLATVVWGGIAIGFASVASLFDNLIEAVNILGSIFYGTILGLFVVAFFLRWVTATPVLIGALVAGPGDDAVLPVRPRFLWFNVTAAGPQVGLRAATGGAATAATTPRLVRGVVERGDLLSWSRPHNAAHCTILRHMRAAIVSALSSDPCNHRLTRNRG
jgi:Na+/proline symporter